VDHHNKSGQAGLASILSSSSLNATGIGASIKLPFTDSPFNTLTREFFPVEMSDGRELQRTEHPTSVVISYAAMRVNNERKSRRKLIALTQCPSTLKRLTEAQPKCLVLTCTNYPEACWNLLALLAGGQPGALQSCSETLLREFHLRTRDPLPMSERFHRLAQYPHSPHKDHSDTATFFSKTKPISHARPESLILVVPITGASRILPRQPRRSPNSISKESPTGPTAAELSLDHSTTETAEHSEVPPLPQPNPEDSSDLSSDANPKSACVESSQGSLRSTTSEPSNTTPQPLSTSTRTKPLVQLRPSANPPSWVNKLSPTSSAPVSDTGGPQVLSDVSSGRFSPLIRKITSTREKTALSSLSDVSAALQMVPSLSSSFAACAGFLLSLVA